MANDLIDSTGSRITPISIKSVDSGGGVVEFTAVKVIDAQGNVTKVWPTKTAVETFEDGDHVNWDRWGANWSVDGTEGLNGSTYGALCPDGVDGVIRRYGDMGLGRGTKFEVRFSFDLGGRIIITFDVSTTTNDDHYEIWCFNPEDSFELAKDTSNTGNNTLTSTPVTFKDANEYRLVVENDVAGDGTLKVSLYDVGTGGGDGAFVDSLSAVDTELSGDGVGAYGYASSKQVLDEVFNHG